MEKMERDEKLWGGIFGIIAIVAAIAEIFINGVNASSIVGAIKDVSGTLVVVVLLVAFIRNLPHKANNFDDLLNQELQKWIEKHNNMTFIKTNISDRDIYMKTDVANFFTKDISGRNGRFAIIKNDEATKKFKIIFSLNKSLFIGHDGIKDNIPALLESFGRRFETYGCSKYDDVAEIHYDKSSTNLTFTFIEPPKTDKDIVKIIEIIDTIYQAFLVCASTKA